MTREHDPGDAVPPGVAPLHPPKLTPEDEAAKRALEKLGPRNGRASPAPAASLPDEHEDEHEARTVAADER